MDLGEHEEVLLFDGEPFRAVGVDADGARVQMIWAPGPNLYACFLDAPSDTYSGKTEIPMNRIDPVVYTTG